MNDPKFRDIEPAQLDNALNEGDEIVAAVHLRRGKEFSLGLISEETGEPQTWSSERVTLNALAEILPVLNQLEESGRHPTHVVHHRTGREWMCLVIAKVSEHPPTEWSAYDVPLEPAQVDQLLAELHLRQQRLEQVLQYKDPQTKSPRGVFLVTQPIRVELG